MFPRKRSLIVLVAAVMVLAMTACATTNVPSTPSRTYYEAQELYFNAWSSYHNVWLALPATDLKKAEWVKSYHPLFLEAGLLLQEWGKAPGDVSKANVTNLALDRLESILIQLAIKKGGK
jgi:hypothetical protein